MTVTLLVYITKNPLKGNTQIKRANCVAHDQRTTAWTKTTVACVSDPFLFKLSSYSISLALL